MRMTWWNYEDALRRRLPYLQKVRAGKADNDAWAMTQQRAATLNRGR